MRDEKKYCEEQPCKAKDHFSSHAEKTGKPVSRIAWLAWLACLGFLSFAFHIMLPAYIYI
jgi:hypothetical protein